MKDNGRPRKYDTNERLTDKINEFFTYCDDNNKPYTLSGLCLYLDITRETLCNYEDIPEFFDTIKRAKKRVENYVEEKSLLGILNPTVSIFNLKNNFGWKDKQEVENTNLNVEISKEDKELIETIKKRLDEK